MEGEEEMEKSVEDTGVRFMDLTRRESRVVVEEWEEVDVAIPWSSPKDRQALATMSAICFLTARYWYRRYPGSPPPSQAEGAHWSDRSDLGGNRDRGVDEQVGSETTEPQGTMV